MKTDMVEQLVYWVIEREKIRIAKATGQPKPWTADPVLQQFKFCNVRREHDRVTQWFADNWRERRYWGEPNFVPAMILGRIINWPDTLAQLGFPHVWDAKATYDILEERRLSNLKVYTGAYMVSQYGSKDPKNKLVVRNADAYFTNPPKARETLADTYKELVKYEGVGPFMAGQVIADLKYTKHLQDAPDWETWAVIGPGSTRGLNRIFGRPINYQMSEEQGLEEIHAVQKVMKGEGWPLHAQDVQNCMCEFDKFIRTKTGQGVPRSRYPGF